jgi:fructosamine-3-kinase
LYEESNLATMPFSQIQNFLSGKLQTSIKEIKPMGGGCINQTYKITTADKHFFCKINSASKFPHLFEKERNGLALIEKQNIIKVPKLIAYDILGDQQILILEWIEEGVKDNQFWKTFGEQLASLHQISSERFGLDEDNFMGSIPQNNKQHQNWTSFFIEQRIQPLVKICIDNKLFGLIQQSQFEAFYQRLSQIFNDEKTALVHGDLWSGNYMCSKNQPVLIDPAVYFGHRSVDLAMTTLFGGFDKNFYEAYHYHHPLPANYIAQWEACNLYPLLIHLILFGKTYLAKIQQTLDHFE